jgi:ATP-dependent Clp protease adaptor protein ClpS
MFTGCAGCYLEELQSDSSSNQKDMIAPSTIEKPAICWSALFSLNPDVAGGYTRAPFAAAPNDPDDPTTVRERPLVVQEEKSKPKQPPLYAVILLNDDYTPREFVTRVLKKHFGLDGDTAETIMMHAHRFGEARVGAWQKDVAETKMHNAEEEASEAGHPLQFRCHPIEP